MKTNNDSLKMSIRVESDSMGEIDVSADKYWGAQTQRSLKYFAIGQDIMPAEIIRALALVKKSSAFANQELGLLPAEKARLIAQAADEIVEGKLGEQFPLRVWMTGSGTQSNMNVNEVIANRGIEIAGGILGSKSPLHPNDHVNMSQSTNDVFPTAMNIACALKVEAVVLPAIEALRKALHDKATAWAEIIKIGRTHLMDAVPLTLGQEFSGYVALLDQNLRRLNQAKTGLYELAIGGTAVGTGVNAPAGFADSAISYIRKFTNLPFEPATNRFSAQGSHDELVMMSGALKTLAVSLYKLANDIRLMGSGPRSGLQELMLPENEPGSSIMPGKVNPTQCEVLAMVAVQVMGYDTAVAFAGAGGYLEMNVYKPLLAFNVLQSMQLLADSSVSFANFLVKGLEPNTKQLRAHLDRSLMLVTALSPSIGYDKASKIAHVAKEEDLTLKEAALKLGYISAEDFDALVDPTKMVG